MGCSLYHIDNKVTDTSILISRNYRKHDINQLPLSLLLDYLYIFVMYLYLSKKFAANEAKSLIIVIVSKLYPSLMRMISSCHSECHIL